MDEMAGLSFDGPTPDLGELSRKWHSILREARSLIAQLPTEHAGKCVLDRAGAIYTGDGSQLETDLAAEALLFHSGCVRGAFPRIVT